MQLNLLFEKVNFLIRQYFMSNGTWFFTYKMFLYLKDLFSNQPDLI